ncbi:MAG: hypothetical protein J5621_00345 [Paludibacteraceae bacterium]|nr:hypothetical protein [Paludibacteraceae bacterium]
MKKFFYVALMALTVAFTSCGGKAGSSDFYNNGKEPEINYEEATVNGVKYNDTDNKCWKYTITTTVAGFSGTADTYVWGTEFAIVAACEWAMYTAHEVPLTKAKYSFAPALGADTEEACEELEENNTNK